MKLLIALVNYNGSDLTIDCLKSLVPELQRLPDVSVVVCDNGSGAGEFDRLAEAVQELAIADRVTVRAISPNQGFTGGNNVILREALASAEPPDAAMLLNNDTLIRPGAIERLIEFMEQHPQAGVCASRLEYPDGESQRAARRFLTILSEFEAYARTGLVSKILSRWLVAPPDDATEPHLCGWAPGAALLMRRSVLESVGLLDEGLYTYFDDVDYCLRARRAGWPTWFVPESRIVHLVGRTTGITTTHERPKRRPAYWFAARRRFFLKNYGPLYAALADLSAVCGLSLFKLRLALTRKPDPDPPCLLRDLLAHSVLAKGFRVKPVINPLTGVPVSLPTAGATPA